MKKTDIQEIKNQYLMAQISINRICILHRPKKVQCLRKKLVIFLNSYLKGTMRLNLNKTLPLNIHQSLWENLNDQCSKRSSFIYLQYTLKLLLEAVIINKCYLPVRRFVLEKTVPEVLSICIVVLEPDDTIFPNTGRLSLS